MTSEETRKVLAELKEKIEKKIGEYQKELEELQESEFPTDQTIKLIICEQSELDWVLKALEEIKE